MKQRNVFYLVETIQPWVGTNKFEPEPFDVSANHKLFRDENEAYEAFFADCAKWKENGAKEFNTFFRKGTVGCILQMRQYVLTLPDQREFAGYTKLIELKAK